MTAFHLRTAVRVLKNGGIIAYPTEAVYGLGCNPQDLSAVKRILEIKQRPAAKGLILIAADFTQLERWLAPLSASDRARIDATWPGPVTWLLPARQDVPACLRGAHATLAVRVTKHALAAALCRTAAHALISTSANISGHAPARSALAVRRQFASKVDYIVPGRVGGDARPSEIRDLRSGQVVRI